LPTTTHLALAASFQGADDGRGVRNFTPAIGSGVGIGGKKARAAPQGLKADVQLAVVERAIEAGDQYLDFVRVFAEPEADRSSSSSGRLAKGNTVAPGISRPR